MHHLIQFNPTIQIIQNTGPVRVGPGGQGQQGPPAHAGAAEGGAAQPGEWVSPLVFFLILLIDTREVLLYTGYN